MERVTIAVIDDDVLFLKAIQRSLSDKYDVICMQSSLELVEFLTEDSRHVDAFFVDLDMADTGNVTWQLGGLSAVREIRAHYGLQAPFIGVLTGMDAIVHSYTCLKNGADEFIEKSAEIQKIAAEIQERLEQRAA